MHQRTKPQSSIPLSRPAALGMENSPNAASRSEQLEALVGVDPSEVLLCDLGGKSLQLEDFENALRLWRQPVVLMAGNNWLDRLPTNIPSSILYLDLSRNRLTSLEGFTALPSLRELDVSHNDIQSMLGLLSNINLRVLRISHNCIRRIEGLHHLKLLEEADLSHNRLKTAADVRALSLNSAVRRLRMEGNPFCTTRIQHGSYVVAMLHLLPSMNLLDGKPLQGLSSSRYPPPQPSVRRTLDNGVGGPIQRTITPEVKIADRDSQGDVSISRKWRDLGIVAGREAPISTHEQDGRTPVGIVGKPWAKRGGGGPAVDSGSYLEGFLLELQRERRAASLSPTAAATAAGREIRGVENGKCHMNNENHSRRRVEGIQAANAVPATAGMHRRRLAGRRTGDRDIDGVGVGVRGTHGAIHATPDSPSSYRGLTRAERVQARRVAWVQARQEDALGIVSIKAGTSNAKKSAGPRSPRAVRSPGIRPDRESRLTARELKSPRRRINNGVSAETSRSCKNQALAAGMHRRRPAGRRTGDRDIDGVGVGVRGTHGAIHATPDLPSSYRGLTRVERVKAPRMSQGQARQEDALGIVSIKAGTSNAKKSAGPRSPRAVRSPGIRPDRESRLTARELKSPRRRINNGVSAETSRSCKNQALAAGKRTPRVPSKKEGRGGGGCRSSAGMASQNGPTSKLNKSRHLGIRSRSHDTSPGARRVTNGARQHDPHVVGEWNSSDHAPPPVTKGRDARRRSGVDTAGSRSGDRGTTKARNTSGTQTSRRDGATHDRFRTTLGRRSRREPPLKAPQASRCTPREDAKPWRERSHDWRGASECKGATDHESQDLSRWCFDQGVEGTLAPRRGESPGSKKFLSKEQEGTDRYRHYAPQNEYNCDGAVDEGYGSGTGVHHRAGRISRAGTPFVPPLSTADIMRRRSWPESSGESLFAVPGTRSAAATGTAAAIASHAHWSGASRTHPQATANHEWSKDSLGERSSGPRVLSSTNHRRSKLGEGSTESSLRYSVDTSHTPEDLFDVGKGARHGSWGGGSESLSIPTSFAMSRISPESTRGGATDRSREPYGKRMTIPERYEVADSAHDSSPELSDWTDGGRDNHAGRQIEQSNALGQWKQQDAERQRWLRPLPPVQPVTLERASAPIMSEMMGRTTNAQGSDKYNLHGAAAAETANEYPCSKSNYLGSVRRNRCNGVRDDVEDADKEEEDNEKNEVFCLEGGHLGHSQLRTKKDSQTSFPVTGPRNTIARSDGEYEKTLQRACSPGVKIDKEEVRQGDPKIVIHEAGSTSFEERGSDRTGRLTEACKELAEDEGLSTGSTAAAGQESGRAGSPRAQEGHAEKAGIARSDDGECERTLQRACSPGVKIDKEEVRRGDPKVVIREAGSASSEERGSDWKGRLAEACKELEEDEGLSMGSAAATGQELGRAGSPRARERHAEKAGHEVVTLAGFENEIMDILASMKRGRNDNVSACSAKSVASNPGLR